MAVIPALLRCRKEDWEFKSILGHIQRHYLQNRKSKETNKRDKMLSKVLKIEE
jgi:hypothetical protein